MGNSDILLNADHVRAIRRLLVAADEDDEPSIELIPEWASLHLGGNGVSDGDLRLRDENTDVRIHYTAGGGGTAHGTTRAFVHGGSGDLLLGANGVENEDVAIRPKWAALSLGGGDGSNSDGDIKLIDRGGKTRFHFDGGGNGPASPATTSLYADGDGGTLHFRPAEVDNQSNPTVPGRTLPPSLTPPPMAHPMLYMYSGPTDGGPRDWTSDGFPSRRPVISHNPNSTAGTLTGLIWDQDDSQFVMQKAIWKSGDSGGGGGGRFDPVGGGGIPSDIQEPNWKYNRVLTVDLDDEKVGVNTNAPEEALHVEGRVKATEHVIPSDARYKTNVEGISGPDALEAVQSLRGVRYEWDEETPFADGTDEEERLGFVAQEVEEVLPESISEDEDGYRSMSTDAVAPVLVEAVKDQQDQLDRQQEVIDDQRDVIDEQRETIEAQRDALADLQERVARLEGDDGAESGGVRDGR